jgi:hypothetical protein
MRLGFGRCVPEPNHRITKHLFLFAVHAIQAEHNMPNKTYLGYPDLIGREPKTMQETRLAQAFAQMRVSLNTGCISEQARQYTGWSNSEFEIPIHEIISQNGY